MTCILSIRYTTFTPLRPRTCVLKNSARDGFLPATSVRAEQGAFVGYPSLATRPYSDLAAAKI